MLMDDAYVCNAARVPKRYRSPALDCPVSYDDCFRTDFLLPLPGKGKEKGIDRRMESFELVEKIVFLLAGTNGLDFGNLEQKIVLLVVVLGKDRR